MKDFFYAIQKAENELAIFVSAELEVSELCCHQLSEGQMANQPDGLGVPRH